MIDYLPDTNILSRIFKGDLEVRKFVESLECAIDATVYIECLQGSKANQEKRIIENYLMRFPLLPITPESSVRAIDLIRSYSNYNLNEKDFSYRFERRGKIYFCQASARSNGHRTDSSRPTSLETELGRAFKRRMAGNCHKRH